VKTAQASDSIPQVTSTIGGSAGTGPRAGPEDSWQATGTPVSSAGRDGRHTGSLAGPRTNGEQWRRRSRGFLPRRGHPATMKPESCSERVERSRSPHPTERGKQRDQWREELSLFIGGPDRGLDFTREVQHASKPRRGVMPDRLPPTLPYEETRHEPGFSEATPLGQENDAGDRGTRRSSIAVYRCPPGWSASAFPAPVHPAAITNRHSSRATAQSDLVACFFGPPQRRADDLTVFKIADNRGADMARSILATGKAKVVVSDRLSS
jgi:hypothetical protein